MAHVTGPSNPNDRSDPGGRSLPDELVPTPSPAKPSPDDLTVPEQGHDGETPYPGKVTGCFGRYDILEEIAHGGMGVVYKALDRELGRCVALKTIRTDREDWSGDLVRRFRLEARAAARLRHPNIVTVFDFGTHEGKYFFAMQFQAGGSLAGNRARFQQDPAAAAGLIEKVARAVHFAHAGGILHRDLKPANILLDEAGEPYVSDFGLAKPLDSSIELTCPGEVLPGTPAYMAPEQAAGRASQVCAATDVWALGVILYELLTGRRPFTGESRPEVSDRICHYEPPTPRSLDRRLDAALEAVVLRCLEKDPARRFPSAKALADELGRWRRGEPTLTRPEGLPRRIVRAFGRRPILSTALATAVTVSVLFGLIVLLFGTGGNQRAADPPPVEAGKFAAEKRFSLLGEDGTPVREIWPAGGSALKARGGPPGTLSFKAESRELLELLPAPPDGGYRFQAEVKVEPTADQKGLLGQAGIYFSHSQIGEPQGRENWYGKLSFGLDSPVRQATFQCVRYREENGTVKSLTKEHEVTGVRRHLLPALPVSRVDGYHLLEVEVKHGEMTLFCDGNCLGTVTPAGVSRAASELVHEKGRPLIPGPAGVFSPRGGIGLYNCLASASFRNVLVTPFEP
jgi:hypothetical protein